MHAKHFVKHFVREIDGVRQYINYICQECPFDEYIISVTITENGVPYFTRVKYGKSHPLTRAEFSQTTQLPKITLCHKTRTLYCALPTE